jgi:hypothetical protein
MSATVRFYAHVGLVTAAVNPGSGRYSSDSVSALQMPYLARETVTANTGTAQSTTTTLTANSGTRLVHCQIQVGSTVALELNPPNRSVAADSDSPRYAGETTFIVGPNWTISTLEIA